ncbi:hypothetical protein EAF04_007743 [Stromatinia cepivora]|nr:hypothetical protein EAF04_007743 [Stromatinia cepivora]
MVQRSRLSSAANHFLNGPHKCAYKYVGNWYDAYELEEASPYAPWLNSPVPPAPTIPYLGDSDWKSAKSAAVELERCEKFELAELRRLDEQLRWSYGKLARGDIDDITTTDLLPPSIRLRLMRKGDMAGENDCANGQTPRDPSQSNLTSGTCRKINRAPRTPLPSAPTPQKYKWLVRRLYENRPLSHHSGALSELKLKLDIAQNMTHDKPGEILRDMREIINMKVILFCPQRRPITVGNNISMKEKDLRDTKADIQRINGMTRGGPDGQSLRSVADLEEQKDRDNDLRCKVSIKNTVNGKVEEAARSADARRAHKSSHCVRTMDQYFNHLKESGGADFLKKAKHCLSAMPWYMRCNSRRERVLGTGLSNSIGAGNGVKRKRSGFEYDPDGEKSSLRMVTNVRGSVDECLYVIKTGYGLATSIRSVDDEFDESNESIEDESEESVEDPSDEDEDQKEAPPSAKRRRIG